MRFGNQPWSPEDHVFRSHADELATTDERIRGVLNADVFAEILRDVPDEWLEPVPGAETPEQLRAAYVRFLSARLDTRQWLPEVATA